VSARDNVGRYVAASRDGELRFFSTYLDLLATCRVQRQATATTTASVGVWVTDVVCMLNVGMLAVACTPGFIAFYSAVSMSLVRPVVVIDKLEICPSSVDYWSVLQPCLNHTQLALVVLRFRNIRLQSCVIKHRRCSLCDPSVD